MVNGCGCVVMCGCVISMRVCVGVMHVCGCDNCGEGVVSVCGVCMCGVEGLYMLLCVFECVCLGVCASPCVYVWCVVSMDSCAGMSVLGCEWLCECAVSVSGV